MVQEHRCYQYACGVLAGKIKAPRYVILQCAQFKMIADGRSKKYCIDEQRVQLIDDLLKLMVMPKGLKAGKLIYACTAGFQWLAIIAVLCTVYRKEPERRRYETMILEICRKNGKTYFIAIIFILLLFLEPKYSRFYSVAPDGALSREVQVAIKEIIGSSPALSQNRKFKVLNSSIKCFVTENEYFPLNYSRDRLDGKLPSVFLVDEAGALPSAYAIEAMRSGQLTILNKLGCVISTKYPTIDNPFEDEVAIAKKVLDGLIEDDSIFSLLYEPDDTKHWETNDEILEQANPLALELPAIMEALKKKRVMAIASEKRRENFITKHCNIIYQGVGTETYIPLAEVKKCKVKKIDWAGREVYVGVDLAMTNDNCAVAMVAEDGGSILAEVIAFVPEGRIEEKNAHEKLDYYEFIRALKCIACGDLTVDYEIIENFVFDLEEKYSVTVMGIGYDRMNAMSSAQKWERGRNGGAGYNTVIVRQHSDTLHMPTKLLSEAISGKKFQYEENKLLEINFQNARCTYDTNLNRYLTKKKSSGKVDMIFALLDAIYLLQQEVLLAADENWGAQG